MNYFNPIDHKYFIDNDEVPSVTQLLPGQTFYVSKERLKETEKEGISNHRLIEMYFDCGAPGSDPMLNALDEWIHNNPQIGNRVLHEKPLFSEKHRFAGTPDAIFENAIIDFKRSGGDYKRRSLQAAGYHLLAVENKIITKVKTWLVMWFDGRKWNSHSVYDPQAENIFISLVKKYYIEKELNKWMSQN